MKRFKISLPGIDILRAKLNEEVADSLYPSPKVDTTAKPAHTGIIFLNWASTNLAHVEKTTVNLYSFPHNYGYVPTVLAAYKFDNGSTKINGTLPFQMGALGLFIIDADQTNINLKYFSIDISNVTPIPAFTMQVRFYVFAEVGV